LARPCEVRSESEKRVAAIEAEAEVIKRDVDAYVAKRQKVRRIFSFWKSN